MKIDKKITSLVLRVQELVIQSKNISMFYQSDICLLSIYKYGDGDKYDYIENVYLNGFLYTEKYVIEKLQQIIKDLEGKLNEVSSI